jgi:hypothetical protein
VDVVDLSSQAGNLPDVLIIADHILQLVHQLLLVMRQLAEAAVSGAEARKQRARRVP